MPETAGKTLPAHGLRKCRTCGEEKTSAEFRPNKLAKSGKLYPRLECRQCENAAWRLAWREGRKGRLSAVALAVNAPSVPPPVQPAGTGEVQLEESIRQRMELYRSNALGALHDLAMMPISANSAQNQVKLLAASKLYSVTGNDETKSEIDATLRALNEQYQQMAPKIKEIRERVVTFEASPVPLDTTS